MKKKLVILFIIPILFISIIGCGKKENKEEKIVVNKNENAQKFKKEYEEYNDSLYNDTKLSAMDISEDNPIYYATADEVLNILDGTGIIFFAHPMNQTSRDIIPTLFETAEVFTVFSYIHSFLSNGLI